VAAQGRHSPTFQLAGQKVSAVTDLQQQIVPQAAPVKIDADGESSAFERWAHSPKQLARTAGVLYLLVVIVGGFAEGYVYPMVYAAGDAATTAGNLIANSGLVRLGVAADLFQATVWVLLAMTLYLLLKHVHKDAARAMVTFAAIGASITCLNAVFEFEALRVATGAVDLSSLTPAGSDGVTLLLTDTQNYGLIAAQIFFGLWVVPLGYLVYKSGWFPKALGVLLIVGALCYIVDALATFLFPDISQSVHSLIAVPGVIAELWMVGYLLVIGVKTEQPDERMPGEA